MVRDRVTRFLKDELKIETNLEKTKITCVHDSMAEFLGCYFGIPRNKNTKMVKRYHHKSKRTIKARINQTRVVFWAPKKRIIHTLKLKGFIKDYEPSRPKIVPKALTKWIFLDHRAIIMKYNAVINGLMNYYSFVDNLYIFHTIVNFILKHSCAHTLSRKFRLGSRASAFKKFGGMLA